MLFLNVQRKSIKRFLAVPFWMFKTKFRYDILHGNPASIEKSAASIERSVNTILKRKIFIKQGKH